MVRGNTFLPLPFVPCSSLSTQIASSPFFPSLLFPFSLISLSLNSGIIYTKILDPSSSATVIPAISKLSVEHSPRRYIQPEQLLSKCLGSWSMRFNHGIAWNSNVEKNSFFISIVLRERFIEFPASEMIPETSNVSSFNLTSIQSSITWRGKQIGQQHLSTRCKGQTSPWEKCFNVSRDVRILNLVSDFFPSRRTHWLVWKNFSGRNELGVVETEASSFKTNSSRIVLSFSFFCLFTRLWQFKLSTIPRRRERWCDRQQSVRPSPFANTTVLRGKEKEKKKKKRVQSVI